jgi:charged multivesicular body protein 4
MLDTLQDALKDELAELEQEVLDEKLAGASHVPVHTPAGPSRVAGSSHFTGHCISNCVLTPWIL